MQEKYLKTLKKLYETNLYHQKKENLNNLLNAAEILGNPHLNLKIVHITGTNGKGSVALKLSKIFEFSNFKTGLFTSPHLFSFRERVQINSEMIQKQEVSIYLNRLFEMTEKYKIELSYFEYVWLMSLLHFVDHQVEILIAEGGLGGTLDAVNICNPLLSIITTVGLDHCETLGNTLQEIASNKAGIIKPNKPAVIGFNAKPYDVFINQAKQLNSKLTIVQQQSDNFNQQNNFIVKESISILKQYPDFENITDENTQKGLQCHQLCRLQQVSENIYLDVGHNEQALKVMFDSIKNYNKQIIVIFGTSSKKDLNLQLNVLQKKASKTYFVQANHKRAMDINEIKTQLQNRNLFSDQFQVLHNGNIHQTIQQVIQNFDKQKEIIVICGSFFIMEEASKSLGIQQETDDLEINQNDK